MGTQGDLCVAELWHKEQALLRGETYRGPGGPGLGWSGRQAQDQLGARSAESSSVGLSPRLDPIDTLQETPLQWSVGVL